MTERRSPLSLLSPSRWRGQAVGWVLGGALMGAWMGSLTGCQEPLGAQAQAEPTDAEVLAAEALRPARPELTAIYERSCMVCHGVRSAAPLTGHAASWQPRVAQGMDTLLAHTREGLRGMPAMGMCPDCSDQDLRDLVAFMSTPR